MPCLKLQTNQPVSEEEELVKKLSKLLAVELGKPESYVMVILEKERCISMGGEFEPAVFIELKSIGLPGEGNDKLSAAICDLLQEELAIPADRVYIVFSDIARDMWGWNGGTF